MIAFIILLLHFYFLLIYLTFIKWNSAIGRDTSNISDQTSLWEIKATFFYIKNETRKPSIWRLLKVMWIVRSVVLEMREDWTGDCRIWPHFLPVGEVVGLRSQEELLNSKSQGPGEKKKKKKTRPAKEKGPWYILRKEWCPSSKSDL